MTEVKQLTEKVMIEFAKTIEMFDLSPMEARVFSYLYLADEALTLDEMAEALGKSKTSMSNSIRNLADLNLVSQVWKKGVRKDLYQANTQLFKSFMTSYINKWIEAANYQKDNLETILEQAHAEGVRFPDEEGTKEEKLSAIIEFHQDVETLFRKIKPQ
ncbi:GbsR/MarR family transcriptional regulator [Lentibacillus sediminis]|uniref:GbsR/MarR family transcriptional regulator n=1 Tax=Lentibacillus sediminis TaxID=1940529 RepID=UPI000C1C405C|nr:MarR family transcriptional regulator [Lentibacillus sediminis]